MWKQAANQLDCISFTHFFFDERANWRECQRSRTGQHLASDLWILYQPMIILYLFLSHAPVPLLVAKASKLTCSGVAPGYLPVPELENTPLTGNVKYILRNVYIIQIFQVPVTFHCRGTPLPHASTRPLKGALTNKVNNKLTCTPINTRLKFSTKKNRHLDRELIWLGEPNCLYGKKVIPARRMSLPGWLG